MKSINVKKAENGYIVTVVFTDFPPPLSGTDYVFVTWAEVTTFLTDEEFVVAEPN